MKLSNFDAAWMAFSVLSLAVLLMVWFHGCEQKPPAPRSTPVPISRITPTPTPQPTAGPGQVVSGGSQGEALARSKVRVRVPIQGRLSGPEPGAAGGSVTPSATTSQPHYIEIEVDTVATVSLMSTASVVIPAPTPTPTPAIQVAPATIGGGAWGLGVGLGTMPGAVYIDVVPVGLRGAPLAWAGIDQELVASGVLSLQSAGVALGTPILPRLEARLGLVVGYQDLLLLQPRPIPYVGMTYRVLPM